MSLIHLLSVGQSLETHQANAVRYRMRRENLLPDFSVKNTGGVRSTNLRQPSHSDPSRSVSRATLAHTLSAKPGGSYESVRVIRPEAQTELNLDTVRVVRNNLADDDLEFVSAKCESNPFADGGEAQTRGQKAVPFSLATRVARWMRAVRAIF